MALFILPLLRIIFFMPIYLAYMGIVWTVRLFLYSTSSHQLAAYLARRQARAGNYTEAGTWYAHMFLSDHYITLLGKSIWGPRKGEVNRFLDSYGDKLPFELRNLLGDLVWSYAFLLDSNSVMKKTASDSTYLLDLAEQLVVNAYTPKDPDKIDKLIACSKVSAESAPKLAVTLQATPELTLKHPMNRLKSPISTEKPSENEVRTRTGECCLCGDNGEGKGLDLYAAVHLHFQIPIQGTVSGGTDDFFFTRFLGYWELLFCSKCVTASDVKDGHKQSIRVALISGAIAVVAAFIILILNSSNYSGAWVYVIFVLVGLISLITAIVKAVGSRSFLTYEFSYYKKIMEKFVRDNRSDLLTSCDLSECVLHWRGVHKPTSDHVVFYIEPHDKKEETTSDERGFKWRTGYLDGRVI